MAEHARSLWGRGIAEAGLRWTSRAERTKQNTGLAPDVPTARRENGSDGKIANVRRGAACSFGQRERRSKDAS